MRWRAVTDPVGGMARSVRQDFRVTDENDLNVAHVLVLPDRDAAEEAAEELARRYELGAEPEIVREALAGEDDAEDAQWLIVLPEDAGEFEAHELDDFAREWDGWRETP